MELGLELTKHGEDFPHRPKRPHMVDENKYERVGDHINMLLDKSLM
jgi:hypothetical protein